MQQQTNGLTPIKQSKTPTLRPNNDGQNPLILKHANYSKDLIMSSSFTQFQNQQQILQPLVQPNQQRNILQMALQKQNIGGIDTLNQQQQQYAFLKSLLQGGNGKSSHKQSNLLSQQKSRTPQKSTTPNNINSVSPMKGESSNNQKRREKNTITPGGPGQSPITHNKESRIQQMKNEIRRNEMQIQHQLQMNSQIKSSTLNNQDNQFEGESKFNQSHHSQFKEQQSNNNHQKANHQLAPYLQPIVNNSTFTQSKKQKLQQMILKIQRTFDGQGFPSEYSQNLEEQELALIYQSPQFRQNLIDQSENDSVQAQELSNLERETSNISDTQQDQSSLVQISPQKNIQGMQGESQQIKPKSLAQPNNHSKSQRPSQFSFGQISPKFYKDQPAANLLDEEDALQGTVTSHQSASFIGKRRNNSKGNAILNDYQDKEDNEASLMVINNRQTQKKLIQSQNLKEKLQQQMKQLKTGNEVREFFNAEEIYNDLLEDFANQEHAAHSTGSQRGFRSKESLNSNNQHQVPHNMRKIRVDSFAKTPYFLKSPRSLASSQIGGQDLDNDYTSLNTYHDDGEIDIKQRHYNKLSQSSDEIAKTVNIFFEKKNTILDTIPSQNALLQHNYSPIVSYQQFKMPNQQYKKNLSTFLNQNNSTNIYLDQVKFAQIQMINNQNYIQVPHAKYLKSEGKKGKFKMPKMTKILQANMVANENHQQYNDNSHKVLAQTRSSDNRMQQQNLLRVSQQLVNPNSQNQPNQTEEKAVRPGTREKGDLQVMRKNKQIFLQHQQQIV